MRAIALFGIAVLASLPLAATAQVDIGPVVAAERAFAADGQKLGVKTSFLKHSTPTALMMGPGPINAHRALSVQPDPVPGDPTHLFWWPVWAGMALSGDMGFTSGPISVDGKRGGYYFTVWRKQADGGWKWIYDGGGLGESKDDAGPDGPVAPAPAASARSASPAIAMAEVSDAEAELAARARTDQKAAYMAYLAPGGRIYTPGQPVAPDREALGRQLDTYGASIAFDAIGGEASAAGDLAWTYGAAEWTEGRQVRQGHYVRVWQKHADGWKLTFAQILAMPAPRQG